jgi:hypothetical protein
MFEFFHWHVTNELSNIPSMVRKFDSQDRVKNEEEMIKFNEDYFTGKQVAMVAQSANSRTTPWTESLDYTMFYL